MIKSLKNQIDKLKSKVTTNVIQEGQEAPFAGLIGSTVGLTRHEATQKFVNHIDSVESDRESYQEPEF